MKELVLVGISITFAYSTALDDGETRLPAVRSFGTFAEYLSSIFLLLSSMGTTQQRLPVVGDIPPGLPGFMPAWDYPASKHAVSINVSIKLSMAAGSRRLVGRSFS